MTSTPDLSQLAIDPVLKKLISDHFDGGGSVTIAGNQAATPPVASQSQPKNFHEFATDPANGLAIQGALNTKKGQPTPFNMPPQPGTPSIFSPTPNPYPEPSQQPNPRPTVSPRSIASTGAVMPSASSTPQPYTPPSGISEMQAQTAGPSLPAAAAPRVSIAPVMSQQEFFAAHPEMQAHPQAQTPLGRALFLAAAGLTGAAGGMHGDPTAGLKYVQGVTDQNNSIADINQARYENGAVKPYQQALQNADTQSIIQQRLREASQSPNVQTVQTADGVMQRDPQSGAWTKIGDSPSENKTDTPENLFLQDYLKRNPQANIGDAIGEYTKLTAKPDQKPDSIEQQYADEYIKRHPGAGIQEAVRAYAAATQKPERGDGGGSFLPMYDPQGKVHFFNPKTGTVVDPPSGFGKTDPSKQNDAYQGIVEEADNAHKLQKMAESGNAEADADLALSFFKVMKGANGSGIRFTQTEQNLIKNARSSSQDLQAVAQKVLGSGEMFTPKQRQNIVSIIDLHATQARNHLGGSAGGSTPSGGQNAQPQAAAGGRPEGTRIKMPDGSTQVKRNGKWVPE